MTVTTALYRRYRPDSFADVIGQEHVTEPLMTALRKNRVNHAYLFSGPRGCGKTTSARILARCLNCAQGPTDTPCGTCPSCVELARGGSGSLDVIEIDAASHGGVDDARDLRERATYAPVRDRYKIFIIDEAHMVTSAGFNALLKIVEEPPEHIKFIFATTEPDKVIGTIRSRTHHYPFRLVPPEPLMAYLELLCRQENVPVAPGVLSLVIRAGGGSVRDSLSVLDQLMAGAGPSGLDYELAVALLGYTHASLLDDVVEAVAASDAATVFRAVDRVIQTGHDPRRFVEDLLERFRDLIIVQAMPESAQTILRGMPADQIARLQNQAHNLGAAELSRAADVTNTALTEMTGATSPRLHLELLCARILLPSSEQSERGMAARIDRVERRLNYAGNDVSAPAAALPAATATPAAFPAPAGTAPAATPAASPTPAGRPAPPAPAPAAPTPAAPAPAASAPAASAPPHTDDAPHAPARITLTPPRTSTNDWPVDSPADSNPVPAAPPAAGPTAGPVVARTGGPGDGRPAQSPPAHAAAPQPAAPAAATSVPAAPAAPAPAALGDVEVLRRAWPDILQTLSKIKRSTWALVEPNAQVGAFDGQILTLSFTTPGLAGAFGRADHSENLRQAIHKTIGIDCQISAVAGSTKGEASSGPNPKAPVSAPAEVTAADVAWGLAPASAATDSPVPPAAAAEPARRVVGVEATRGSAHESAPRSGPDATSTSAPEATSTSAPEASSASAPKAEATSTTAPEPAPGPQTTVPEATVPEATVREAAVPGGHSTLQPAGNEKKGSAQAAPDRDVRPAAPSVASSPEPSATGYSGGDYAYSDDDWGPPRDEDAPPLDEEPPMDWVPPAKAARPATPQPAAPTATLPAEPVKAPAKEAGPPAAAKTGASDIGDDPWARAVEQAPGVWVVGDGSNVGTTSPALPPAEPTAAKSAPRYEPAAAQVPQSIPVTSAGTSVDAEWGLAVPSPAPASGSTPQQVAGSASAPASAPAPAAVPAREYAMAAAAPAGTLGAASAQAAAAPAPPASAAPPAAAGTRQSLYQRLSTSPEAVAGRVKSPSRAESPAAAYVQDIPSADDETIEESGVFGRAAVERILGGKLVEERALDGSSSTARY